jgi:hypothetical protein
MAMTYFRDFTSLMNSLLYIADDAILAFTKQAAEDIPVYKDAFDKKSELMNTLKELTGKADQLFQKRQGELD